MWTIGSHDINSIYWGSEPSK